MPEAVRRAPATLNAEAGCLSRPFCLGQSVIWMFDVPLIKDRKLYIGRREISCEK